MFPVPDGDTGSNMLATVRVALEEAEGVAGQPADRIAAAISFGALMGARGNSGRDHEPDPQRDGRGLVEKRRFNGLDLAHAWPGRPRPPTAPSTKPVEGTILTVIREASVAAKTAAERDDAIETVLAATVDAAEKSVAKTPTLLPILREAGVVDSGGQGLYRLFQGALRFVVGEAVAGGVSGRVHDGAKPSALVAHADEGFGYETMFLVQPAPGHDLDIDGDPDPPRAIGESVVVAGDSRAAKVHVHNERPDERHRLRAGPRLAQPDQRREPRQPGARRPRDPGVGEFTAGGVSGDGRAGASDVAGGARPTDGAPTDGDRSTRRPDAARSRAVVAVAAGDGLAAIFRTSAWRPIVRGGQSANPSTGELLAAIERRQRRTRSCSCRTIRTSSSPLARSPTWPIGRSTSSDPQCRRGARGAPGPRPGRTAAANVAADDRARAATPGRSR